jgi:hypothetical protein
VRRAIVALGIVAMASSACGEERFPARLATTLQDRVATIRGLAEDGRPGLARDALRGLVQLVNTRLEDGRFDDALAVEILDAAAEVEGRLALLPRPSPSPSSSPTTSPSPSDEDEEGNGHGESGENSGNGKGNGKGKGDGDGDGDGGD